MKSKNNVWFWVVISIYVVITILRLINHQPWFDEAHAYSIAQEMNLLEIIQLMSLEGHTFLWYLLLMPFAKLNLWYPWPMFIMNYAFALISVIILWKKAPFSNLTKTLVTFSFPFFACLPILARCYAIGVMFLFLLQSLFKDKLKHPLVYSTLIVLCANTSVMAIFGAAAYGFIFLYDLIKSGLKAETSKKDFIVSSVIMAFGAVLIFWQLGSTSKLLTSEGGVFLSKFLGFLFGNFLIINWFALISFVTGTCAILLCLIFAKNLKGIFYYIFTFGGLLTVFLTIYAGWPHHFIFLYIYVLLSAWFLEKGGRTFLIADIMIAVMFAGLIFNDKSLDLIYFNSRSVSIAKSIINDPKLKDARIIVYESPAKTPLPLLKVNNIDVWDYCSSAPADSSIVMNLSTPICTMYDKVYLTPYVEKVLAKDKDNYSILSVQENNTYEPVFMIQQGNVRIIYEFYRGFKNSGYLLYKTTRVEI